MYHVNLHQGGNVTNLGQQCIEPGDPVAAATAPVLTPGRILEAFRRIPLPEAPLEVQPPGGETLVNLDTILLREQGEDFVLAVVCIHELSFSRMHIGRIACFVM